MNEYLSLYIYYFFTTNSIINYHNIKLIELIISHNNSNYRIILFLYYLPLFLMIFCLSSVSILKNLNVVL